MTKIIVLTDLHIVPEGETIIGIDPLARLHSAIEHIHAHNGDADLVVITGDLTHYGDPESYQRLKGALSKLRLPLALLIGNHDKRDAFRTAFPETPCDENGFVQCVRDVGPARLICLDTVKTEPRVGAYHSGQYCERRLAWLDRHLRAAGDKPVHLFMHHPPHETGFAGMDRIRLENEAAFYACLSQHSNVRHIVCGHIHRTISGVHRGIPYAVFKSTVHQQPMTFASLDTSLSIAEPAAYGILFVHAHGVMVHTEDFELASSLPIA